MNFNEMFTDAFKYPLSDYKKFFMLAIPNLILSIFLVIIEFMDSTPGFNETMVSNTEPSFSMAIFILLLFLILIIGLIFILLLDYGMVIQTIKKSLNSDELLDFDIRMFFVSGLKYLILEIGYILIPIVIYLFIFMGISIVIRNMGVILVMVMMFISIVGFVVFLVIGAMNIVSMGRLAETNSLSEAFDFKNIYAIAKKIDILKIVGVTIIFGIIILIISLIMYFIELIPLIGIFISVFIVNTYILLVNARLAALLYKEQYIQPAGQNSNQPYMPNNQSLNQPQKPNYQSRYADSNSSNQPSQQIKNQQVSNNAGVLYQEDESIINKTELSDDKINNLDFNNTDSSQDDEE